MSLPPLHLPLQAFAIRAEAYDEAVRSTPGINPVCSSADWLLSAHRWLHPPRQVNILEQDGQWLALARGPLFDLGRLWQPLETGWCFACPLVGPNPAASVELLERFLADQEKRFPVFLGGIPAFSPLHLTLRRRLPRYGQVHALEGLTCLRADLSEGYEAWLGRRSGKFRKNLRQIEKSIRAAQLEAVAPDPETPGEAVFDRCLSIEERSWKWLVNESALQTDESVSFYRDLCGRLARRGKLRARFLQRDGVDIAYLFGGVSGTTYRGFQMGFAERFRDLVPGHFLQATLMRDLAAEGLEIYDLGMDLPYKRRWSDHEAPLRNLILWTQ